MHLYLHVPFCARRCSYCDFAIAVRRQVPAAAYAEAIVKEWEWWRSHEVWDISPTIETIYFGGGTPSLLNPDALHRILDAIRDRREVAADAEVTLEANPDDVSPARAARWRALGINRVSLGVQSFDPSALQWMHRTHTAEDVPSAIATLRTAGFDNISLDLIFGLPSALHRDWRRDLDCAIALGPEHLSLYGLTIEPHTPLARWIARGESVRTDDEAYAREFLEADRELASAGFDHYEVSNAAKPGYRARHNSAYWRRRPFIGLGPSAHSGFGRTRQWNVREWAAYQAVVQLGDGARDGGETLEDLGAALETLYLGLRTSDGVEVEALPGPTVRSWTDEGWARELDGRVSLTPEGWLRLDALVASVDHGASPGARLCAPTPIGTALA